MDTDYKFFYINKMISVFTPALLPQVQVSVTNLWAYKFKN